MSEIIGGRLMSWLNRFPAAKSRIRAVTTRNAGMRWLASRVIAVSQARLVRDAANLRMTQPQPQDRRDRRMQAAAREIIRRNG